MDEVWEHEGSFLSLSERATELAVPAAREPERRGGQIPRSDTRTGGQIGSFLETEPESFPQVEGGEGTESEGSRVKNVSKSRRVGR